MKNRTMIQGGIGYAGSIGRGALAFVWLLQLFCGEVAGQVVSEDSLALRGAGNGLFYRLSGFGERVLDWVTWDRGDLVFLIYPSGGVSPRNGLSVGLSPALKWKSDLPGRVNMAALDVEASTKGLFQVQAEYECFFNEYWQSRGALTWSRRGDRFWPLGQDPSVSFSRREFEVEGELLRQLSSHMWGGILLAGSHNQFNEVDFGEGVLVPLVGLSGGSALGGGPLVVCDSRNRVLSPDEGALVRAQYLFYGVAGSGDFSYRQWQLDGRYYLSGDSRKSVYAFQMLAEYAGEGVPFYRLPFLGGKDRLRGIGHPLRSTGNAVWLLRGEYRRSLWWRLGGVLFAGGGKAAPDFNHLFNHLTGSIGGGLRFRVLPHDPLNIRIDYGVSSLGDSGFFISLKEAF